VKIMMGSKLAGLFARRRIYHGWGGKPRIRPGEVLTVNDDTALEPYSHVLNGLNLPKRMGAFSYAVGELDTDLVVGRYCSLAYGFAVMARPHPTAWASSSPFSYNTQILDGVAAYHADNGLVSEPLESFDYGPTDLVIGNDVWVGTDALIKRGVTIGNGAVIGARSVVTRDVPPYAIVAGVPARLLRYRFDERLIERLQALRWWDYGPDVLRPLDIRNPLGFVGGMEDAIAKGAVPLDLDPVTTREMIRAVEPDAAV
jgi:virginiamycin A acetyltransferase